MELASETSLTFDDVLLEPGYKDFTRSEIHLEADLTRNIQLARPLISAPMDTVTESDLAIALAKNGGIGIIHRNLTIEDQAIQVEKVKQEGGIVGAAVGSKPGYEKRTAALVDAGVDVIVVDSADGYSKFVIDAIKTIKAIHRVDVIGGNVATREGAQALIDAGVDGLRVGMGPGAICTTRIISGMGVPQLTAIIETSKAADRKVPIIADGGINNSGDITKALAAGASSVMLGRLFAATEQSSGEMVTLIPSQVPNRFKNIIEKDQVNYRFKAYRGMGSKGSMEAGKAINSEDEFHGKDFQSDELLPEGVEGLVPCSGHVDSLVTKLMGGLVSGMYYIGARDIHELWDKARFVRITQASLMESHPHDLFITNSGGNY